MKIHNLVQGSPEWHEFRARCRPASEAAAMLGISPYKTRNELLHEHHTGVRPEPDQATQRLFNRGHEAEAAARPRAEEIIGDELFPATVSDDDEWLSSSLDGITMDGKAVWEHKLWSDSKAAQLASGEAPEHDMVQIQQQMMITGAERCLYMLSDGSNMDFEQIEPDPEIQQRIIDGWKQFDTDLAAYEPPEVEPEAVGAKMADLPALSVEVEGKVLATNIDQYRDHALAVFDGISTDLQTDQDFADAEETVKWCKDIEGQLDFAKKQALAQTATIDELFRAVDEVKESARQKRLELDRLVKSRKEQRRSEIRQQAIDALRDHYRQINATLDVELGIPAAFGADVAGAMKGKRTIQSLIDAADQALTDAKLAANAQADRIRASVKAYQEHVGDHGHLFPDYKDLVLSKAHDDMEALIKTRIAEYEQLQKVKQAESERKLAEAEAERKQAEEAQKAAENTQRSPATDPPPPDQTRPVAEGAGTGEKAQATERWRVSVVFEFDAPADSNGDALADALKARLVAAGFQSVADAVVEKQRVAA